MKIYNVEGFGHWLGLNIIVSANDEEDAIEIALNHLKNNDEYLYLKNKHSNYMKAKQLNFNEYNAFIVWNGDY